MARRPASSGNEERHGMPLLGRRRWDPQPTAQAAVLLASSGEPFSRAALRRARELAGGQPVAVLPIPKTYGSSFGLPNPGLIPTPKEPQEQPNTVHQPTHPFDRPRFPPDHP